MTGPIALVGSLLEDSGPRGKEGTVPIVLAYPHSVSGGSGRGQHLWPSHLFSEAGLGFGGVSTLPWEPSWPGLLSPGRMARGPLEPRSLPQPAFQPLPPAVWGPWPPPPWDWLVEVPPLWPTFPHGKQEAGRACPRRIE